MMWTKVHKAPQVYINSGFIIYQGSSTEIDDKMLNTFGFYGGVVFIAAVKTDIP